MNAIIWAARSGVSIKDATLYCSLQPCFDCTKNIIATGIKKIVYEKSYNFVDNKISEEFLSENNVETIKLK
jgi:dCMP deaminase